MPVDTDGILFFSVSATHLAEDINFFGHKIVALLREAHLDRQLIEKLGRELTVFGHALRVLKDRGINLEDVQHDA